MREPTNLIPFDPASIRPVPALRVAAEVKAAFSLENRAGTEAEIVGRFQAAPGAEHGGFERR